MARTTPAVPPGEAPELHPARLGARLLAFAALASFVAHRWTAQLDPAPTGRLAAAAGVAIAVAVLLTAGGAVARGRRVAWPVTVGALAAGGVAALAGLLLISGVADELLRVSRWGDLLGGLTDGASSLPDLRVPYRGEDEWTRSVLVFGGGLLIVLGGVLVAAGKGRPLAATTVLGIVFAIPVVTTKQDHPVVDGVLFALFAGLLAVGWRVPRAQAPAAILAGVAALAVAALAAPLLDGARPLVDYQRLGQSVKAPPTTIYDWNHSYDPLGWPRSGRELLRVKATEPNYLKGVTLNRFDGVRWLHAEDQSPGPTATDGNGPGGHLDWRSRVSVTVRELRSRQLYAPGQITDVVRSSARVQQVPGGSFVTVGRLLTRGDSYVADTYSPRPTKAELQNADAGYATVRESLRIEVPATVGGPPSINPRTGLVDARSTSTVFPRPWGAVGGALRLSSTGQVYDDGDATMAGSAYARTWALAQRLREASGSPYDLALRVQRRVRQGAVYDERPPRSRVPLEAFLFDVRRGYCQQFSGAMALLMRMAGVPARVASGFAPGRRDRSRNEYVVTDLDAHSWVEVFFPNIGWVVFDPTPAAGSPASQFGGPASSPTSADATDTSRTKPFPTTSSAGAKDASTPLWRIAGAVLLAVTLLALLVALVLDRRSRRAARTAGGPELAELLHALAVTGRQVPTGTTLVDLQRRFAGSADAGRYLAAVVRGRFGGGAGPDGEDRAALRRALAQGLGVRGALRAWWALPPARPRGTAER